ncbi:MAG TPA: DnaJ domain-containing protein [Candidatus Binatia bacterium]|nr:DnaJ domain-containing protein [Candidatus Binatia bacterium]
MSETFYEILGVGRSATADQIRAAYRDLVKKYHPDLFPTAAEKAKATDKLRAINEAYAVLGNADRRQRYDQQFVRRPRMRRRPPGAESRRKTGRPHSRRANPERWKITIPKLRMPVSRKWIGYFSAATIMVFMVVYAARSVPSPIRVWVLLEKLEISPPQAVTAPNRARDGWARVADFPSVSHCATAVKEQVRRDEREGSRAVYDEKNGTMAITVQVRGAAAAEPSLGDAEAPQKPVATKRIRNLECRAMQRVVMESWFQRTLRGWGWLE